jgi:hypothetical protein
MAPISFNAPTHRPDGQIGQHLIFRGLTGWVRVPMGRRTVPRTCPRGQVATAKPRLFVKAQFSHFASE